MSLSKSIDFEVKYSFRRNYKVIVPSHTNTIDNAPLRYISVYLETLEYNLQFSLPRIVMKILQIYDIIVAQLVPNA